MLSIPSYFVPLLPSAVPWCHGETMAPSMARLPSSTVMPSRSLAVMRPRRFGLSFVAAGRSLVCRQCSKISETSTEKRTGRLPPADRSLLSVDC